MPEGRALEGYTQNYVFINQYRQQHPSFALSAALNSQEILLSQLYYGAITLEHDRTQPYADITQMRLVPDTNGDNRYIFIDKSGNKLNFVTGTLPLGAGDPDTLIPASPVDGIYDLTSGLVYRRGSKAITSTGTTVAIYGVIDIKPLEGAALAQKNEELSRASNVIQILASIISLQQQARSAFVNAVR